jgi:starch synthase (maltosyl-transferring)
VLAPDHPWIKEHPEWFDWRPDGTIKFAENPPKKYEDIVNVHFYREALPALWYALRDVVLFWVGQGREDLPRRQPAHQAVPVLGVADPRGQRPAPGRDLPGRGLHPAEGDEALAKLGFTQSYSYFTWRNTKYELTEYLTELTQGRAKDYMRPNFFANTPDINPVYLQTGGRAGFRVRPGGDALGALRPLLRLRALRGDAGAGQGGVSRQREVPDQAWDWDRPGTSATTSG